MAISFDDIENAFLFVSMGQQYMHNAYLCKDTGQVFYTFAMGDSDYFQKISTIRINI
jgi:hypothetical protein